ncbi:ATP-binding cassette domain-containing protein [Aeromicrobium choanae]|uniref:Branched-chain amino acid transport system ATP-binding protein n=1 Tax=Aeromicrobium choanae TaxID=1736691 RepID=A0A1T4YWK6_9ACTN|nr:ATP-binding cassette domain-containing protein [Aeromicrobium choanae]SKB06116.1 branched-chain amino acid transport system ATP-binding protein [Aeromicrobium choanae]
MTASLSVRDLNVSYRGVPAVSDYAVDLEPGTLTMMLGRNGAGKTSTLRGIVGFLPGETGRSSGRIELLGKPVRRPDPLTLARAGLELIAERNKVFTGMTVDDQLRLIAPDRARKLEVLEYFPRLQERLAVRAGLLSGGERQMLATALALLRSPEVLLVDELSLGLAPAVVRELMQHLRRLADDQGIAILAADQSVSEALAVADRVQVMDDGAVVAEGAIGELDVEGVLDTYLGREKV